MPENPFQNENQGGSQQEGEQQSANYEALIKDNVTVKCTYSDYMFTFTITSQLKSKLPHEKIEYGIGHFSTSFQPITNVSVGNQAYYYSSTTNGDTEVITFKNPFWFYYVFVDEDKDKWTHSEMYYASYCALINKGLSSLSTIEMSLYHDLSEYLDEYVDEVRPFYMPTAEVVINDRFYAIRGFRIPQ